MQPSSPIYFLDMPFAENGDKTIIPAEEATADGRATQSEGFPEITQQPIASGGIAPNRWDFNGMFFLLSQFAHWEQSGGQATWNSELGYTPPSIVYYNKVYYVCIAESGPETDAGAITPGTNSDYWVTLWDYLSDGQSFVKNGDTVTLTGDTTGSGTFDEDGNVSIATTTTTATKLGSSTVGGTARGIYLDSGTAKAMSATVGSGTKPVYLSSGTVTVSNSTVGTSAKPVYLSSGTITASSSTIGSGVKPVYMSSGAITASSSTVGSGKKPVYLSSGTITESSSTVGDSSTPVYLNSGTLTECNSISEASAYKKAQNGYIQFTNSGIIIQWGYAEYDSSDPGVVNFSLTFPTACWNVQVSYCGTSGDSYCAYDLSPVSITTEHFYLYNSQRKQRSQYFPIYWVAIGY